MIANIHRIIKAGNLEGALEYAYKAAEGNAPGRFDDVYKSIVHLAYLSHHCTVDSFDIFLEHLLILRDVNL